MNVPQLLVSASILILPLLAGCDTSEPTTAVLSNEYCCASDAASGDKMPVYKAWWSVAQFPAPVPAGRVSDPVRVVQGSDYGYALLAPGWDESSGSPPTTLIPLRSAQKLSVERGDSLTFVVSPQTTLGDCLAGTPLARADADYVTQRIFPKQFAGLSYDAASCKTSSIETGEAGAAGAGSSP
jgi:hypothetical protein